MLQKYKRKDQLCSFNSTVNLDNQLAAKDSPKAADELDLRISSVVKSKGYQIRVDYGMRKNEDEISE